MSMSDKIVVAKIVIPHGLKGQVKVRSLCDNPRDLADYKPFFLYDGSKIDMHIGSWKKDVAICGINGVYGRDKAELLRGRQIFAFKSAVFGDYGLGAEAAVDAMEKKKAAFERNSISAAGDSDSDSVVESSDSRSSDSYSAGEDHVGSGATAVKIPNLGYSSVVAEEEGDARSSFEKVADVFVGTNENPDNIREMARKNIAEKQAEDESVGRKANKIQASYFAEHLIGIEVYVNSYENKHFGHVVSVKDFGAGDLLEILRDGEKDIQKSFLVPFVDYVVKEVDMEKKRVLVDGNFIIV